jgi:hypothetical protein
MTHPLDPYTYILDADRRPVNCPNDEAWFEWFATTERHVAIDRVGVAIISTVFVGIDRSYGSAPHPLVFETHIFGGEHDGWEESTASWDEAKLVHAEAVAMVQTGKTAE